MYISWECQIGRDLILVVKLAGAWRNLLLGNIYKTRNRTAKFIELCDNRSSIPYTSNQLANINKKNNSGLRFSFCNFLPRYVGGDVFKNRSVMSK